MRRALKVALVVSGSLALAGAGRAGQGYAPYGAKPYAQPKAAPISVSAQKNNPIHVSANFVNLFLNGSFEANGGAGTNLLTNWTVVDQAGGAGSWYAQTGLVSPTSAHSALAPPDGTFAAMSDQPGPGSHILYQDVAVPAGGAWLKADISIHNWGAGFIVPSPETLTYVGLTNQHFRFDIMSTAAPVTDVGAGVLRNVFITTAGSPNPTMYVPIYTDMAAFAGQTVRVRFAEVDNSGYLNVGVDDVVLAQGFPVPTLSWLGIAAMAIALVAIGLLAVRRFMA